MKAFKKAIILVLKAHKILDNALNIHEIQLGHSHIPGVTPRKSYGMGEGGEGRGGRGAESF